MLIFIDAIKAGNQDNTITLESSFHEEQDNIIDLENSYDANRNRTIVIESSSDDEDNFLSAAENIGL